MSQYDLKQRCTQFLGYIYYLLETWFRRKFHILLLKTVKYLLTYENDIVI
jgi:hypothetical protein